MDTNGRRNDPGSSSILMCYLLGLLICMNADRYSFVLKRRCCFPELPMFMNADLQGVIPKVCWCGFCPDRTLQDCLPSVSLSSAWVWFRGVSCSILSVSEVLPDMSALDARKTVCLSIFLLSVCPSVRPSVCLL